MGEEKKECFLCRWEIEEGKGVWIDKEKTIIICESCDSHANVMVYGKEREAGSNKNE